VGVLAVVLSSIVLRDPPYLKEQRAARKGKPFQMDFVGLGLLSVGLASLELMLDKGQEHDWFDSHFIVWLAAIACCALVATFVWELRHPAPVINLRLFRDRNFSAASVCVFCAFGVLYGSNVLLPQMLQTLNLQTFLTNPISVTGTNGQPKAAPGGQQNFTISAVAATVPVYTGGRCRTGRAG
jgi:MFS transporter, DHA2 family, multidrug resistance protein